MWKKEIYYDPKEYYFVRQFDNRIIDDYDHDLVCVKEWKFESYDDALKKFDELTNLKVCCGVYRYIEGNDYQKTLRHNWFPRKYGWKKRKKEKITDE